jgi:hypothetical protein
MYWQAVLSSALHPSHLSGFTNVGMFFPFCAKRFFRENLGSPVVQVRANSAQAGGVSLGFQIGTKPLGSLVYVRASPGKSAVGHSLAEVGASVKATCDFYHGYPRNGKTAPRFGGGVFYRQCN